jgi:hypothetical protein
VASGADRGQGAVPAKARLIEVGVLGAMTDLVTAPLRRVVRTLVAPTEEEREREADAPEPSREERAEAARRHADAHLRERDARRARSAAKRDRT